MSGGYAGESPTPTVVIIGHGSMAARGLEIIKNMKGVEVPLVIADAADQGEDGWRLSFAKAARRLGFVDGETLIQPNFPHSKDSLAKLQALNPTLILSLQCQKIIRMPVINSSKLGVVNCHNAPLPLLRGCDPFAWAIHDGLLQMGVTLHRVLDEGVDNGPILCQKFWPINSDTTAWDLYDEGLNQADTLIKESLLNILEGFEKVVPQPQQEHLVTYHPMKQFVFKPLDMDWNLPVVTLSAFARARIFPVFQTPTFELKGQKIETSHVEEAKGVKVTKTDLPGTVMSIDPLTIAAKWGALRIHKVRVQGEKDFVAADKEFAQRIGFADGDKCQ